MKSKLLCALALLSLATLGAPAAQAEEHGWNIRLNGTWTAPALIDRSVLIKDGDELVRWRIP